MNRGGCILWRHRPRPALNSEQAKKPRNSDFSNGKNIKAHIRRCDWKWKNEVYLQIIQEVLNKGKAAIMLVPSTPQMPDRFISPVWSGSSHSALGFIKRWESMINGGKVGRGRLGSRWTLSHLCPFKKHQAVIIDEERGFLQKIITRYARSRGLKSSVQSTVCFLDLHQV